MATLGSNSSVLKFGRMTGMYIVVICKAKINSRATSNGPFVSDTSKKQDSRSDLIAAHSSSQQFDCLHN